MGFKFSIQPFVGFILALSIFLLINFVTSVGLYCAALWWNPYRNIGGALHFLVAFSWYLLVLYNFFATIFVKSGYVPLGWKPENPDDEKILNFCHVCVGFKPPRAHHCRRCKRCIMRMDHHCPWVNQCCGYRNHVNFVCFSLFIWCGCVHAAFVFANIIYCIKFKVIDTQTNERLIVLSRKEYLFCMYALGLSIGTIYSLGLLFWHQLKGLLKNESSLETTVLLNINKNKSKSEKIDIPYDLGWRKNVQQICFRESNGIHWPVAEGCHMYSFVMEENRYKEFRLKCGQLHQAIENFDGSLFPINFGWKVIFNFPFTTEPRIRLNVGDEVVVMKSKRLWMYGEVLLKNKAAKQREEMERRIGWFPLRCVKQVNNNQDSDHGVERKDENQNSNKKDI